MTDIEDTRDEPLKKRVPPDAHSDWMPRRVSQEHRAWLEGNGSLGVHHFTAGWSIHTSGVAQPPAEVLGIIVGGYNAKMMQTAVVKQATYRTFFREMEKYEAALRQGLPQSQPSLSQAQIDGIVGICTAFRVNWVQRGIKTSFDFAAQEGKPGNRR